MSLGIARGGIVGGALLVLLGFVLLIHPVTGVNPWAVIWPFCIIIPGLAFFLVTLGGGRPFAALAIPGSVLTTLGLILFYQNTFGYFESWAYAWALVAPGAVGLGLALTGHWGGHEIVRRVGTYLAAAGLGLFVSLAAIFEVGVFRSSLAARIGWPLLLIAFGITIVAGSLAHALARREHNPQIEHDTQVGFTL
jgi:hypothetical protein